MFDAHFVGDYFLNRKDRWSIIDPLISKERRTALIRVKIQSFDYESITSIYIYRKREDFGIDVLGYDPVNQIPVWRKYSDEDLMKHGEVIAPSFKLFADTSPEIKKALVDALGKSGFISESHEGARGKLEATEKHLEDMRMLVFKGKRISKKGKEAV